jgi:hypothetical protein
VVEKLLRNPARGFDHAGTCLASRFAIVINEVKRDLMNGDMA